MTNEEVLELVKSGKPIPLTREAHAIVEANREEINAIRAAQRAEADAERAAYRARVIAERKWELIGENAYRLELDDGCLYKHGEQVVFAPINYGYEISQELEEIVELIRQMTFSVGTSGATGQDRLCIRVSNIGE